MIKSSFQQKAEQAIVLVKAIQRPDGTPLFTDVGFAPFDTFPRLPYALLVVDAACDRFKMVLDYDNEQILKTLDVLQSSGRVSWIGKPLYEWIDGKIYCLVSFTVKMSEENMNHG